MYGYDSALSQGTAFNARVKNFNDGVLAHNQYLQDKYDSDKRLQAGKVSDDQTQKDKDELFYGFKDGTGTIGTLTGLGSMASGISKKGFIQYANDEASSRINTIGKTARALVAGKPPPAPATMELGEVDQSGKITTSLSDAEKAGQEAINAGVIAGDAGADVAKTESSTLMTSAIKKGLSLATAGKIGDAGLTTLSEVGGKVMGDFGGVVDIGKSVDNLINHKNFFSGETTADKFQEAGAALDVAGIAFPPAEIIGGALSLTGGIMNTVKDLSNDLERKTQDATTIPPPKVTAVKVSPAYQSMGLVASQLPSAKNQIVGSGSF
jgi:hypothetical protein